MRTFLCFIDLLGAKGAKSQDGVQERQPFKGKDS